MGRLVYRHVTSNSQCQVCGVESESIVHTLTECTAAKSIWDCSELKDKFVGAPNTDFVMLWEWLNSKCSIDELSRVATLFWASWRCRNLIIFENEQPESTMVAAGFCRLVEEYNLYARKVFQTRSINAAHLSSTSWCLPPQGIVKINMDAHVPASGLAGVGVVFRDETGSVIAAATKKVPMASVEIVEATAVRYAIQLARRLGYTKVWCESDAAVVVSAIVSKQRGFSPIYTVYEDVWSLMACFDFCYFSHVKRACNTVAHLVARWDTGNNSELVRLGSFPQSILTLAEMDIN